MNTGCKAFVLRKQDGILSSGFEQIERSELPEGDVLIKVAYSSLNYKDGLAVTGNGNIIRNFPMVPGIDLAGVIEESSSERYSAGQQVIVTGWGMGERFWGGYCEYARVKESWITPLPEGLSLKQAMAAGTAGLTGMLCVMALEEQGVAVAPNNSCVVVTGAAGGVGSFSVGLLARLGYHVTASTGRMDKHEAYLRELGAAEVIDRKLLSDPVKPLESQLWQGAVDTVGGSTLSGIMSRLRYGGTVAACGNAGGNELNTTVFPFILRGIKLIGIDSVMCPANVREKAWMRISEQATFLDRITEIVPFDEIPRVSRDIVQGNIRGRVVIAIS